MQDSVSPATVGNLQDTAPDVIYYCNVHKSFLQGQ